jgi:carbon monoxide dehydrogenase subunit G
MKFTNEITVGAAADALFDFLTDVERVAPCLPGARIEDHDGDRYQGSMKVKVGPITGTYRGTMHFVELDRERRRAVMSARADEAAGHGNAQAWIESEVSEADGGSQLRLVTDLQLRGRVAQFGRGTVERIAQRMFSEFAENIEREIAGGDGAGEGGAEGGMEERGAEGATDERAADRGGRTGATDERAADRGGRTGPADERAADRGGRTGAEEQEPPAMDALALVGGPLARKALPVLLPALIGFGYGYLLGRLRELRR